jgi:hypothetical protein
MKRIRPVGKAWAQIVASTRAFFGPAAAHPASCFLPFVVVAFWTWPCLSCLDFAWAAILALVIFFWFWLRCFDLGDLSLMVAPFDGGAARQEVVIRANGIHGFKPARRSESN